MDPDTPDPASRLRSALLAHPPPETARRHLEAMARAARPHRHAARGAAARAALIAAGIVGLTAALPGLVPQPTDSPTAPVWTRLTGRTERPADASNAPAGACAHRVGCDPAAPSVGGEPASPARSGLEGEGGGAAEAREPADPAANDHGKAVSETARTTEAEGREKGEQVSGVASSKSQGHGKGHGKRPENNPAGLTPGAGEKAGGKPDGPPAGGQGKGPKAG